MKIDVYRNLNDNCLSVRSRETEDYGIVVSHEEKVHMSDVSFVVQDAGQRKCREEEVKNVHAFVRGDWDDRVSVHFGDFVTYDPFSHDRFYSPDKKSYVESAAEVVVTKSGVYANGLKLANETVK